MFDAELFGITSKEFLASAQTLVAPMLGFLFLFLLALPLKKLPIIDLSEYQPPSWVLPVFAIGSLFMVTFCTATALVLTRYSISPSFREFEQSFAIVRRLAPPIGELLTAVVTIQDYDGSSNFGIYVNGYRVFGSSSNRVMDYQCKKLNDAAANLSFQQVQSLNVIDASIYHIHRLYSLPHGEDVSGLLVSGKNIIDLRSENSGVGDCHLVVDLAMSNTAGQTSTFTIEISPDVGNASSMDQPLQPKEIFVSGGQSTISASSDLIPIYGTTQSNGSFRLCQRIRVIFDLSQDQLNTLNAGWGLWAQNRRREIICGIKDDRPKGCPK